MPPKIATIREVISHILYACGGDKIQYDETIDAILNALETYVSQLTAAALHCSDSPSKVNADAVLAAMGNDLRMQTHVQANYDFKVTKNKEDKAEAAKLLGP